MIKVKLDDVIEQLEFASDSNKSFINKRTGVIHLIPDELEIYTETNIEEDDLIPDWEKEIILVLRDINQNPENYLFFPIWN
jgi:hypothetical protein